MIRFNFNYKKQKKDSLIDFYSSDVFTRFGALNLTLFLKGQRIFFSFYDYKFLFKARSNNLLKYFKFNKNFLLIFYFLIFFFSTYVTQKSKVQNFKKKDKKR